MLEYFLQNTKPRHQDTDVSAHPADHEATDVSTQMLEYFLLITETTPPARGGIQMLWHPQMLGPRPQMLDRS